MNYLTLYLNTSEKDYDEKNEIVFYLTRDTDFTDCQRTQKRTIEKRYKTRFEAALVNVGEAVVFIQQFLDILTPEQRKDVFSTIALRNDVFDSILSGEHFDIYEILKYLPSQEKYTKERYQNEMTTFLNQMHNKVELNYGKIIIKWFDKIVYLISKYRIKITIANITNEQYLRDKKRLDNYRVSVARDIERVERREEIGVERVFRHLRMKNE